MKKNTEKTHRVDKLLSSKEKHKKFPRCDIEFSRMPIEMDKAESNCPKKVGGLNEMRRKLEAALGLLKLKAHYK